MSSPGTSPRDLALRLASPSSNPLDFVSSPHISSPLKPPSSPRLRQPPLQSPGGGIHSHQRRPSFGQSYFNVIPPHPILGLEVARRSIESSSPQTSPRQRIVEQLSMSIASSSAGSIPYMRPRLSSGSFNQYSSPSLSGYRPPSLAASPILEAPPPHGSTHTPHPSHKRLALSCKIFRRQIIETLNHFLTHHLVVLDPHSKRVVRSPITTTTK
ncbi:hypothetical protein C8R48DRAFT_382047 [Suillus tomentosus]|nr:hypothetical protein C8R48DRAFT_382047 [Suillus tomentosus]